MDKREPSRSTSLTKFSKSPLFDLTSNSPMSSAHTDIESLDTVSVRSESCGAPGATRTLPLEFWEREEGCLIAKNAHMDYIDDIMSSREDLIMLTTLWKQDTALEPNMFPYKVRILVFVSCLMYLFVRRCRAVS